MGEPVRRVTVEEYLALDEASEEKLEYLSGVVVAMAGASPRHNVIAQNVSRQIGNSVEQGPCVVFGSDQRVHLAETGSYAYPDASVVCERAQFTDERPASLLNPQLIVEVLSPSTRDHDQGDKLAHYRKIASVREVLLVESNTRGVALYRKLDDGRWLLSDLSEGEVELESVGVRLSFDAIYAKTEGLPLDPVPDPIAARGHSAES